MTVKVFLSLSYVDAQFVRDVRARLPAGLSYFYEESFANGEQLLAAMERAVADSTVFVLFASKQATTSPWVNFEIDLARVEKIKKPQHRILVFPTDPTVSIQDLPAWLRSYWVAKAGWAATDVARYITTLILEPDIGLSTGAIRVTGRGKTLDKLEQIVADHISKTRKSPNVIILAGFSGVGRRTFASYYMRRALSTEVNLPYGPTLILSPQADLADVYRALRSEIVDAISADEMATDLEAFNVAPLAEQLKEINRLLSHFVALRQAVSLVSTGGFLEDRGAPKEWVSHLIGSIAPEARLFIISNRQFPDDWLNSRTNAVQIRIDELNDKDIRTLMVFTAERLRVENFSVSEQIVQAIGGHPGVANAAVRLAALKGTHILERDPRQLFNVQQTILGENIADDALNIPEKKVLNVLSWVPTLGGNLLEKIVCNDGMVSKEEFIETIENLVLGCLIIASGFAYSISPAIRQLFRRYHITPPDLLKTFAKILESEWREAKKAGRFRDDLFEAFVFMHALEGKALPVELRSLLSPGTLFDVIRETYARGKDADDPDEMERVSSWGEIAETMRMSEGTREEILSTVARAKIRLGQYDSAEKTINRMADRGNRSALFLRGYLLRRQERFSNAIPVLEEAIRERKYQRSAIHELALAYKKSGQLDKLRKLLAERGDLVKDSAMFADFQIGIDLARGDLKAAEAGIANLARMLDDDGKSDIRRGQLLMRRQQFKAAKELFTWLLSSQTQGRFHIRALRAVAAAKDHDFDLARRDINFVKGISGRQTAAFRLEVTLFTEQGNLDEADALINQIGANTAEDQLMRARVLELKADLPQTSYTDRLNLIQRATEIRARNRFALDYDSYEDEI